MNPNHPSRDGAQRPPDDVVEPDRLAELEQRLRHARPRPPELDIEAIVQRACEGDETVRLARSASAPPGRPYRWISTVAGAWACGAIVGACVTLSVLNWGEPSANLPGAVATTSRDRSPVTMADEGDAVDEGNAADEGDAVDEATARPEASGSRTPLWSRSELLVTAALTDPYGRGGALSAMDTPTIRAGNFARGRNASGSWRFPSTGLLRPEWDDSTTTGGESVLAPVSPTTRERLLRELLGTDPDSIL